MKNVKCLRALSTAMAAEHRLSGDILMSAPSELLSIPMSVCADQNSPHCQCRRVFVGIHSGRPCTLALVCEDSLDKLTDEAAASLNMSPLREIDEPGSGVVLFDLPGIAHALRRFKSGSLLRVNRTADAIYLEDTWQSAAQANNAQSIGR